MDTTTDPLSHVRRLMAHATGDEKHEESTSSTLDALWVLYDRILHVDPDHPDAVDRDRFILSKGHGPVALYAILAAQGFFPHEWLDTFLEHNGTLGSHPDRQQVPGIEASTGSLGHGMAMAVGVAQALLAKGRQDPRVVVLTGDAELNEGSNWEAVMLAPNLRLGNLTWLLVDNHSSSWPMGPWDEWLSPFGWDVHVVDGHDHELLASALRIRHDEQPVVVVADIPKGEW